MHPKLSLWADGLRSGKVMHYREMSCSMAPFLQKGDLVKVMPYAGSRVGDIVLYKKDGLLVMHRVVAKFHERIITKGDALGSWDSPIARGDILGKAISRERRGVARPLDSWGARMLGLAFCLTSACVPKLMKILSALKRLGEQSWAWLSNRNENCISS